MIGTKADKKSDQSPKKAMIAIQLSDISASWYAVSKLNVFDTFSLVFLFLLVAYHISVTKRSQNGFFLKVFSPSEKFLI